MLADREDTAENWHLPMCFFCVCGGLYLLVSRGHDDSTDEKRHLDRRGDSVLYSRNSISYRLHSPAWIHPQRYQTRQPSSGQQGTVEDG